MASINHHPIDVSNLLESMPSPETGAVVVFLGVTREFTDERRTVQLKYEAYEEMALKELNRLEVSAREKWSLTQCMIVHRLGLVPIGEASVAVITASTHRKEAYAASEWLMDTLKKSVPIWKQEHWDDGSTQWVHPIE